MEKILNSNGLVLMNGDMFFTPEEKTEMKQSFEENNIEIFFLEQRAIQNSIFDGIEIILNNNLFNMLVGGVLMPQPTMF
ncbi:hypothetical protein ABE867_16085 [Enterococcus gallinarum]|uniref:hypothetical protein n=1 Tax=Enterococcus gallinarum TaxID=1353 RepID=UPI003D6A02E7